MGGVSYAYDANGNMTTRGSQTITWDAENRPVTVTDNGTTTTFVYDGDGNRVKKIENGEAILYINRYYEVNLTSGNATSYYYLGDRLIAMSENTTLRYVHQDHLTGTSLMSDTNGASLGTIKYMPFGLTRSGDVPTDKKFTGQRLDGTGLYYYNARYYDPTIGRFISPDTIVPDPMNPQCLNRYSYCLNNPLKYNDPTGHTVSFPSMCWNDVGNWTSITYDTVLWFTNYASNSEKQLVSSWMTLTREASALTKALIDSECLTKIYWGNIADFTKGGDTTITKYAVEWVNGVQLTRAKEQEIRLNNIQRVLNVMDPVSVLAHESFHALVNLTAMGAYSRYEEACAFTYQAAMENTLGNNPSGGTYNVNNFTPNMSQTDVDALLGSWWRWIGYSNVPPYPDYSRYQLIKSLYVQYYPDYPGN